MTNDQGSVSEEQGVRIDRTMTIEQILSLFPYKAQQLSQEITRAGLHCIGCHAAVWETLECGMKGHGKSDAEIDQLVERLNVLLDEKMDITTITLTPRAAKKYLSILEEEGKQGWGLRFGDKPAGCNGFEYILGYSEKAEEDDEVVVSEGIEIHVKKGMFPRLRRSRIDYRDGLNGSGFAVTNLDAKSSCHCGSSHGY